MVVPKRIGITTEHRCQKLVQSDVSSVWTQQPIVVLLRSQKQTYTALLPYGAKHTDARPQESMRASYLHNGPPLGRTEHATSMQSRWESITALYVQWRLLCWHAPWEAATCLGGINGANGGLAK